MTAKSYIAQKLSDITGEKSIKTSDTFDAALHAGTLFRFGAQKDVAISGTLNLVTVVPADAGEIHFFPSVECENEAEVALYEAPTNAPTGGSSVTPRNANRQSSTVSLLTVTADATIDLTGATILGKIVVGARRSTGGANSGTAFILKEDTTYIQVVTNQGSAANETTIVNLAYTH